jgi:hypothetical protein
MAPGGTSLTVEVEVARWALLEPEAVVIGCVLQKLRGLLEHVLLSGVAWVIRLSWLTPAAFL